MKRPVILLGCGGHGRVLLEILRQCSIPVLGYTDQIKHTTLNLPYLGQDEAVYRYQPDEIVLVNGLGSVGNPEKRRKIYDVFKKNGYHFLSVVDRSAIVCRTAQLKEGVQVIAGAVVQCGAVIGENSIVNTKASVDHDCQIGSHVHIAPGATLCGNVTVKDGVHIGAGATVIQGVRIGHNSIVAAGAVVIHDVPPNVLVAGVPAKVVKQFEKLDQNTNST